ncbi:MAG: hypothetical protein PHC88_02340 [Terrimicrobiaceae bacterium]|nr:hypothetical protein [Terrimicrobiaceae bacterium]
MKIKARPFAPRDIVFPAVSCKGNGGCAAERSNAMHQADAISIRQSHIADDQIELVFNDVLDRRFHGIGCPHGMSKRHKKMTDRLRSIQMILHQ